MLCCAWIGKLVVSPTLRGYPLKQRRALCAGESSHPPPETAGHDNIRLPYCLGFRTAKFDELRKEKRIELIVCLPLRPNQNPYRPDEHFTGSLLFTFGFRFAPRKRFIQRYVSIALTPKVLEEKGGYLEISIRS